MEKKEKKIILNGIDGYLSNRSRAKMKEEYLFNKDNFSDGPWKKEPDRVHWIDDKTGLDCLIVRHNEVGHLCGYVGVDSDHPSWNQFYDNIEVEIHGGLTYSRNNQDNKLIRRHPESEERLSGGRL